MAWIKSQGPPLPLVVCQDLNCPLWRTAEQETWNRIFHRDLKCLCGHGLAVIETMCCGSGGKLSWNRRTHFLAWWPWERWVISVCFSLEAVWGLLGLRFPLCLLVCEGSNHILSTERIVSVISKCLMSGAIKFSSRAPDRWFVVGWFAFPFVILNSFWLPNTLKSRVWWNERWCLKIWFKQSTLETLDN